MSVVQSERTGGPGFVSRIARWSVDHRRAVVLTWVALLVIGLGATKVVGNRFDNALSLPNTDSQRALAVLKRGLPAQAGDSDQIVLAARRGKLTDPAVRAVVMPMLRRVARLPHVVGVASPYGGVGKSATVSRDGRIGFATVAFDKDGDALPTAAIKSVVMAAEAVRSPQLQVELGGNAVEQLNRPSVGSATAIGVAAAMVILLLSFGSFAAMGLPIATALVGLGAGSGLIAVATHLLTIPDFAQQIAMMIGLGVGVDYALLIVTRYRDDYRRNGGNVQAAIDVAMNTAGRSITFAGVTVVIALAGLYAVGINLLNGVALAASASVLLVLAGSLTLLPALLALAGRRVGEGRKRRARTARPRPSTLSERWVRVLQRRPGVAALAATALMVAFAAPALNLRLAISGASTDQASTTTRKAYDLLSRGFGPGFNGPLVVALQLPRSSDTTAVSNRVAAALRETAGIATVTAPQVSTHGDTASIVAIPTSSPQSEQTSTLVKQLRASVLPSAIAGTGAQAHVGGLTARQVDFTQRLSSKLPLFIGVVIALSALLLLAVFRSLLIPLQGALMNLLSVGASLGILQALFERGWLAGALGIQQSPIEPFLPVILFAIVFGLSMDYEVFLVSRIHEEWQRRGDAAAAIRAGVAGTGRVISAAAAVMIVVFASFATSGGHILELFGIGLASAILLDALVIRLLLLPAVLQLLGEATWKLPHWLDKRLPRLAIEPAADQQDAITEPALEAA